MYLKFVVILFFQLFSINNSDFLPNTLPIGTIKKLVLPIRRPTKCLQPGFENWITYGNNICYYVSGLYQRSTWHDANDFCRLKNASLLSIHDIITNNLFARRTPLLNTVNNNLNIDYNTFYWIGMNSMSNRGIYKWSDGSPTQFTLFTQMTPDGKRLNPDIYLQGRCVTMNSISTIVNTTPIVANTGAPGYWYKADCNSNYGFFCSKNFNTPTIIQPTTPPPGNCPPGDFAWEDGSAIDFTNWEDNQTMVIKQFPTGDDSGEKCVAAKSLDLKWRSTGCTGYTQRNFFVCQTKKVSRTSSASLARLSGGAKAGIVIGVLIGITIIVGVRF